MHRHLSRHTLTRGCLALAAAGGFAQAAHAALGDNLESVARDRARLGAKLGAAQAKGQVPATTMTAPADSGGSGGNSGGNSAGATYAVHEMVTPSGTVVHEFTRADGRVFALTWTGPTVPDLRQLLGASFAAYAASGSTGPRAHGHRAVVHGDLVVQSSGHMRSFVGKAYLASLVPSGVDINALR